jgi:hypothetical protein
MSSPAATASPSGGPTSAPSYTKAKGCLFFTVTLFLASWTLFWVGENPRTWLHDQAMVDRKVRDGVTANASSTILRGSSEKNSTTLSPRINDQVGSNDTQLASTVTPIQSSYPIGYDFLFWRGKNRICEFIRNITGVETLGIDEPHYIKIGDPPPLINLTLHCEDFMSNTGNWLTAIYHIRLAAATGRVEFQFQCHSGMDMAEVSILPWLSGRYPVPSNRRNGEWPYDFGWPEPGRVCSKIYAKLPLHHLAHEIQRDMRRMAVAILGPRDFSTLDLERGLDSLQGLLRHRPPSSQIVQYPRKELDIDDAAIHFRCGDVFGGTDKEVYGLIKFKEYLDRIPKETTKSIGIHTQPFDVALLRGADREQVHDCEEVVLVLVDYLQEVYPNATITIRNTKEDTIPITYARMTMAAHTITTMSTFGIFPSIGTFGEGYFQKSGRQNKFAREIPSILSNFHAMDGPILSSPAIRKAQWQDIINFLTGP